MMNLLKELTKKDIIPLWSNAPFAIPGLLAIYKGLWAYGALILIATIVSFYYHYSDEKELRKVDMFLAYSVIVANLYVLYLAKFKQPYFIIALVFVAIAYYFFLNGKDHKYDTYHGMWHLCSVVITMMCVLAY